MLNSTFFISDFYLIKSYGFSLILINIIIYLIPLFNIFFIFFFFNLNNFTNLSNIKIFTTIPFFYIIIIISLLSLAGTPPLFGFVGKFLMIIFLNLKNQFYIFFIYIFLNLLMIYFYIQNYKFLIKKNNTTLFNFILYNSQLNVFVLNLIIFFSFFLIFGIFFLDDFFLILNSLHYF